MVTNRPIPTKGGSLFGATTIAWEDVYKGPNILWRVPRNIRLGDNIVIREDELACFMRDGKVLSYVDRPGRISLTTLNSGILGNLIQALSGVRQEAEVYYLQRRIFDGKFGSMEPYAFRDPDFGLVNLRLFGSFRWKVGKPDLFLNEFVGTFGAVTSSDVESRLKEQMVLLTYNTIGKLKEQGTRITDLAGQLTVIEQAILGGAPAHFGPLGVDLVQLQGLSINLPEEVQKAVDTRATMSVLGVNYMQYQAGQAMTAAASNPSGGAGTLVGAGVGLGVGFGMGGTMAGAYAPGGNPCSRCGALIAPGNRFCPSCGNSSFSPSSLSPPPTAVCSSCHTPLAAGARFCPNCGAPISPGASVPPAPVTSEQHLCPHCHTPLTGTAKFCSACGQVISTSSH